MDNNNLDPASQYVAVLHELVRELRADVREMRDSKADKTSIRNLRDDMARLEALLNRMSGADNLPNISDISAQQARQKYRERLLDGGIMLLLGGFIAWAANGFPMP